MKIIRYTGTEASMLFIIEQIEAILEPTKIRADNTGYRGPHIRYNKDGWTSICKTLVPNQYVFITKKEVHILRYTQVLDLINDFDVIDLQRGPFDEHREKLPSF